MRIETDPKLDFKDVLIRPKRSTLNSRNEVDVSRAFRFYHTGSEWKGFPLIAANMDVTGTMAMAKALGRHGALTALHKHYPVGALAEFFSSDYDGGAEYVILAHLSGQNNHPEIARTAAEQALGGRQGLWRNRVLLATQADVLESIRL